MKTRILILISAILLAAGCSSVKQKHVVTTSFDPRTNTVVITETSELKKDSFLHWSKYQADAVTGKMTMRVYNAEAKPDTEAIEAVMNSKLLEFLSALASKSMFKVVDAD